MKPQNRIFLLFAYLQLSFSATRFALYARGTLARLCAHDAGWNSSVERARKGCSHGREGRKQRSERDSTHEDWKNIRWILQPQEWKSAIGYKKSKIKRNWVQCLHFKHRITQTIVSWPLWRLVTREKHSRARRRRRGRDLHRRLQNREGLHCGQKKIIITPTNYYSYARKKERKKRAP